jgi:hypothetical protein
MHEQFCLQFICVAVNAFDEPERDEEHKEDEFCDLFNCFAL